MTPGFLAGTASSAVAFSVRHGYQPTEGHRNTHLVAMLPAASESAGMVIILNAPLRARDIAAEVAGATAQYGIGATQVIDFDAAAAVLTISRHLPGNVVMIGHCSAAQINTLRLELGHREPYFYAYRPAAAAHPTATDLQRAAAELEAESRTADVGFPLPAPDTASFVANVFADICETGQLAQPSPRLLEDFVATATGLRRAFAHAQVHHIGSTALGIRAKPIIDILVALPQDVPFSAAVPPLHGLGFYWVDYPENRTRWYFRLGFPRKMHVHLVRQGSNEERIHLLFRDRLLASEQLRREYEELKAGLSRRFAHDRAAYGRAKSAFIESVLA